MTTTTNDDVLTTPFYTTTNRTMEIQSVRNGNAKRNNNEITRSAVIDSMKQAQTKYTLPSVINKRRMIHHYTIENK